MTASGNYTAEEFGKVISTLQSHLEKLGTDVQSQMTAVQDFMGQYNSYLESANASMQGSTKTLDSVSRGQSLFSSEEGGVSAAPVAVSVLAGGTSGHARHVAHHEETNEKAGSGGISMTGIQAAAALISVAYGAFCLPAAAPAFVL